MSGARSFADRRVSKWVLGTLWALLTLAIAVAVPRLPWAQTVEQLRRVDGLWLLAAIAANLLILPLWAVEWRLLIPLAFRVTTARMFEVVSITAAVLNSVPFFAGETSGLALLIARARLSRGAAVSVLAMDQLLVGFAKLAVIAAAAVYVPLPIPIWLRTGILSLLIAVVSLLGCLLLLAHHWTGLHARIVRDVSPSRARDVVTRIVSWGGHLEPLRDSRRAARLVALALAKKTAELLAIVAVQAAFGLQPSLASALLVLAALSITTLVPVAPANLGIYEATVFAAYRVLGVSTEAALGLAIIQHLCFLVPSVATGYAVLTLQQVRVRRLPPPPVA